MEEIKHVVDVGAATAAIVSVLHALPEVLSAIAAGLSIVWYVIRIYDWWRKKKVS